MPTFKRRTFLKNSILTGVGASVLKLDPLMANNPKNLFHLKSMHQKRSSWVEQDWEECAAPMN